MWQLLRPQPLIHAVCHHERYRRGVQQNAKYNPQFDISNTYVYQYSLRRMRLSLVQRGHYHYVSIRWFCHLPFCCSGWMRNSAPERNRDWCNNTTVCIFIPGRSKWAHMTGIIFIMDNPWNNCSNGAHIGVFCFPFGIVKWPKPRKDPDSKVHGANMGSIWGQQDPGGPHVGPMNFAIWG